MLRDLALVREDAAGDFGVGFPVLPGCVTAGRGLGEARATAEGALALQVAAGFSLKSWWTR